VSSAEHAREPVMTGAARRYADLVDQLAEELGRRHGWKKRVADRLGVHASFITKVICGNVHDVSSSTIELAARGADVDPHFFANAALGSVPLADYSTRPGGASSAEHAREPVIVPPASSGQARVAYLVRLALEALDRADADVGKQHPDGRTMTTHERIERHLRERMAQAAQVIEGEIDEARESGLTAMLLADARERMNADAHDFAIRSGEDRALILALLRRLEREMSR
jgi:hypothetical protein